MFRLMASVWNFVVTEKEEILIEALPYINKSYGSKMVIKKTGGGHGLVDESIMDNIMQDVVLLRFVGICPVMVHCGGPEIITRFHINDNETMETNLNLNN